MWPTRLHRSCPQYSKNSILKSVRHLVTVTARESWQRKVALSRHQEYERTIPYHWPPQP